MRGTSHGGRSFSNPTATAGDSTARRRNASLQPRDDSSTGRHSSCRKEIGSGNVRVPVPSSFSSSFSSDLLSSLPLPPAAVPFAGSPHRRAWKPRASPGSGGGWRGRGRTRCGLRRPWPPRKAPTGSLRFPRIWICFGIGIGIGTNACGAPGRPDLDRAEPSCRGDGPGRTLPVRGRRRGRRRGRGTARQRPPGHTPPAVCSTCPGPTSWEGRCPPGGRRTPRRREEGWSGAPGPPSTAATSMRRRRPRAWCASPPPGPRAAVRPPLRCRRLPPPPPDLPRPPSPPAPPRSGVPGAASWRS